MISPISESSEIIKILPSLSQVRSHGGRVEAMPSIILKFESELSSVSLILSYSSSFTITYFSYLSVFGKFDSPQRPHEKTTRKGNLAYSLYERKPLQEEIVSVFTPWKFIPRRPRILFLRVSASSRLIVATYIHNMQINTSNTEISMNLLLKNG